MDCECPVWMYGRTGTCLVPRQSTGFTNLAEAEAMRDALIAQSKNDAVHEFKIADCIDKYLASRKLELGEKTYGQIKLPLGRLKDYCEKQGVSFARKINVDIWMTFKVDGLRSCGHVQVNRTGKAALLPAGRVQARVDHRVSVGQGKPLRDQIDKLAAMGVAELLRQHVKSFGEKSANAHRQFLFRKIAGRPQADREGGLPESARELARAIAEYAPLRNWGDFQRWEAAGRILDRAVPDHYDHSGSRRPPTDAGRADREKHRRSD